MRGQNVSKMAKSSTDVNRAHNRTEFINKNFRVNDRKDSVPVGSLMEHRVRNN